MPDPQELQVPVKTTTTIVEESKPAPPPAPRGTVETRRTVTQTSAFKDFGSWGAGIFAGFIKGGAHAVTSGTVIQVIDPATLADAMMRYGVLFIFHGLLSTALYLQSHPIPDAWNPETSPERRAPRGGE